MCWTMQRPRNCAAKLGIFVVAAVLIVTLGAAGLRAQALMVGVDEAKLHRLSGPAATVIMGNPMIADVTVQDSDLLVITGKMFGNTNLIVLDAAGEEIANVAISVRNARPQAVTLHKGGARYTYSCAPRCETTLEVGDAPAAFGAISKMISEKSALSKGTGMAGGPQ